MNRRSFLARLTSSFGLLVSLYGTAGSRVQASTGHTSYWRVTTVRRGTDPVFEQTHSWCYGYYRGEFLMEGLPLCELPPHDPTYAGRRRAEFMQGLRDAVKADLRARVAIRSKPLPLP